jgi:hypothetical protein
LANWQCKYIQFGNSIWLKVWDAATFEYKHIRYEEYWKFRMNHYLTGSHIALIIWITHVGQLGNACIVVWLCMSFILQFYQWSLFFSFQICHLHSIIPANQYSSVAVCDTSFKKNIWKRQRQDGMMEWCHCSGCVWLCECMHVSVEFIMQNVCLYFVHTQAPNESIQIMMIYKINNTEHSLPLLVYKLVTALY